MRPSTLPLAVALLLPALPAAAKDELPRFGDVTFGVGLAGTATPLVPGSQDVLLSPALVLDVNLLTPIFVTGGVHGGVDASGPMIGWDATLGGVIGGGMTQHGDGRATGDLFLGLPIPIGDDGVYLQLFARGGPYLDSMNEGWVSAGLEVKYSSWWDRVCCDPPPKKKKSVKRPGKKRPAPDADDGYEPAPGPYKPPKKAPPPKYAPRPRKRF